MLSVVICQAGLIREAASLPDGPHYRVTTFFFKSSEVTTLKVRVAAGEIRLSKVVVVSDICVEPIT